MTDEQRPFAEPRLALNRIYTKRGDTGETSLVGGQRVPKDALRIECFGTVDELNAVTGMACTTAEELAVRTPELLEFAGILKRVQHELFNLGSLLATEAQDVHPRQPRIMDTDVARLEREIDAGTAVLPALRSFALPGGSRLNCELHACRTIARRAERLVVALSREVEVASEILQYLNRLSDAFFVWSRWVNHVLGNAEVLWEPNLPSLRG